MGERTELSLSAVLTVETRKSTNFEVSPRTGLLAKFICLFVSTSATSPETSSRPTAGLKKLVESLFLARYPLMRAWNGSSLLSLFTILLGCIGLTIYWFLKYAGEMEIPTKLVFSKLNLKFIPEEEVSLGVVPSLYMPLTFLVVQ